MKKLIFPVALLLSLTMVACGGKGNPSSSGSNPSGGSSGGTDTSESEPYPDELTLSVDNEEVEVKVNEQATIRTTVNDDRAAFSWTQAGEGEVTIHAVAGGSIVNITGKKQGELSLTVLATLGELQARKTIAVTVLAPAVSDYNCTVINLPADWTDEYSYASWSWGGLGNVARAATFENGSIKTTVPGTTSGFLLIKLTKEYTWGGLEADTPSWPDPLPD